MFPNYQSRRDQIDVYAYGPFVSGFMNAPAPSFAKDGVMVINQAYAVNNTQTAEFYVKELTNYFAL